MSSFVSVKENSLLGSNSQWSEPPPGVTVLPDTVFQGLRQFIFENENTENLFTFTVKKGRELIRVRNYVGLLALPDDTQLELMPKIEQQENARPLLLNMLRYLRHTPFRTLRVAHTKAVKLPLWEIFITAFVDSVELLAQKGIQRAYQVVEGNERFWKGKFQAVRQQRENAYHAERLAVEYDTLTTDVPPNRVLKSALLYVNAHSIDNANKARIQQLLMLLEDVAASNSIVDDMKAVRRSSRLFSRYEAALLWAQTLLIGQGLGVKKGKTTSFSLLFPMEQVFEDYVAYGIRRFWPLADDVRVQESSIHLVDEHIGMPKFKLRPDIIIDQQGRTFILDMKWKQVSGREIQETSTVNAYGIEQTDLYQLFAYGKKYESNDLFLIYPATETFQKPLPVFHYDDNTRLHVVPFDLTNSLPNEVEKLAAYALLTTE